MKTPIITSILILAASIGFAQTHLPPKVSLSLTDKQIIHLSTAVDTLYLALHQSDLPAKVVTHIINQMQLSLEPIWQEANRQMAKDSVKKGGKQ